MNCYTKMTFLISLIRAGFKIIKSDDKMYGYTVLCEKHEYTKEEIDALKGDDYTEIISIIEKQKKAVDLFNQNKFDEAIEVYPKYPDAYIMKSLSKEANKSISEQRKILQKGLEVCFNKKILSTLARALYQWDENTPEKQGYYSNNIKEAENLYLELEKYGGNEDTYYHLAMINAKYKKDYSLARYYFGACLEINPSRFTEVWNAIAWMHTMR